TLAPLWIIDYELLRNTILRHAQAKQGIIIFGGIIRVEQLQGIGEFLHGCPIVIAAGKQPQPAALACHMHIEGNHQLGGGHKIHESQIYRTVFRMAHRRKRYKRLQELFLSALETCLWVRFGVLGRRAKNSSWKTAISGRSVCWAL